MRLKTFLLFKVLLISTSNSVTSHPPEQAGNQYNFTESVAESPGSNHGDPGFNESFPTEVVNHLHGSALNTTREEQNGSREVDRDEAPGQQVPASNNVTVGESVSEGTTATSARPLDTSSEQPTSQDPSRGELASSPNVTSSEPELTLNETSSEPHSSPTLTSTEPKSSTHPASTDQQSTSTTISTNQQSSPTIISTDQPSTPTTASTTAPQTSPTITSTTAPESSLNPNATKKLTTTEKGFQTSITQKCISPAASPTTHALFNFGPGFAGKRQLVFPLIEELGA